MESVSKYVKCEDRVLPSMSVAQLRMSVDQPSSVDVSCQDARVNGEASEGQYMCMVCTVKQEVCGDSGRCTIGHGGGDTLASGTSSSSFRNKFTAKKLINNCNTRTLLRVFENAAGNPPTVYGGGEKWKVRRKNGGVKMVRGQQT